MDSRSRRYQYSSDEESDRRSRKRKHRRRRDPKNSDEESDRHRKRKHKRRRDDSSEESNDSRRRSRRRSKRESKKSKKHKKEVKATKEPETQEQEATNQAVATSSPVEPPKRQRMAPMSLQEYQQQNTIREVYDEESGRYRLVRGTGEIIERIVSRQDHLRINQMATRGDGASFGRQVHRAAKR